MIEFMELIKSNEKGENENHENNNNNSIMHDNGIIHNNNILAIERLQEGIDLKHNKSDKSDKLHKIKTCKKKRHDKQRNRQYYTQRLKGSI